MKKSFVYFGLLMLVFTACSKQNETPTAPLNEMLKGKDTVAITIGTFMNGPYGAVTGTAAIKSDNGVYTLSLENVKISNGPDLHVYLSKEVQPVNFIDLGKLKSTAGNQLYAVPGTPDLTVYKYALIHCQQYNHLFGSALLK